MSNKAITWAVAQRGLRSAEKFVLACMANYADELHCCYPSVPALVDDTAQNEKTVRANIHRLVASGHIADTGERRGKTGQIPVYRLAVLGLFKTPEIGTLPISGPSLNSGERLPDLERKTPEIGERIHQDTSGNHQSAPVPENPQPTIAKGKGDRKPRSTPPPNPLPGEVPDDVWAGFVELRVKKRAPLTEHAVVLLVRKVRELAQAPAALFEQSIERGWTTVYPLKGDHAQQQEGGGMGIAWR